LLALGLAAPAQAEPAASGPYPSILDPQGPVGLADRAIMIDSLVIMLAVVIPVIVATLAFTWWYRASNTRARYLPDWAYSGRLELVIWSIPVLVIVFLGGMAWIGAHDLDPAKPLPSRDPPLRVQVVSLDWKWLFIYPDQGVASVNELVVPAGQPVRFMLTSASVMNVFFVPQLGSMIYTMNGMSTQLNLQADKPGVFYGESAHFSGDGFSGMHFDVRAVSPGEFADWIQEGRASTAVLDDQGYRQLEVQSQNVPVQAYRAPNPNLYFEVVSQKLPPGPGPTSGRPTAGVSPRSEP
jgi:cytochrome o ubiquinol oxidase subunit 2